METKKLSNKILNAINNSKRYNKLVYERANRYTCYGNEQEGIFYRY